MTKSVNYFGRMLCALLLCAGLVITGCYDDSALQGQIGSLSGQLQDHESRLKELERLTAQQNTNISSLQTIITALQDKDYVTSVAPINEGDEVVGYTITFSKSGAVTIYNGKDGYVPAMGVKQDTDGLWYWTVDGEWLRDSDGEKVRASAIDGEDGEPGTPGQSGVTPQLKIVDGYWYVSYDGGKTWEEDTLGQATGDKGYTMFAEVTYDENNVYITMADGEKLTLPRKSESQDEGEEQEGVSQVGPVKIRLSSVTATTATFTGSIDASDEALDYIKVIIRYSRPDSFSAVDETLPSVVATKPDFNDDKTFSITLHLDYAAEYMYCIIVQQKNDKKYSEVSSFATPPVSVELDVESNTQTTVQFKGKIDPPTAIDEVQIAVLINTSETVTKSNYLKKYTLTSEDIKEDGSFDVSMSGLKFGTTYHYTYYVLNNHAYSYGTIQTFKTEDVPITIEVESIDRNVVTFKGNVQFSEPGVIGIGVQYYPKSTTSQSAGIQTKTITETSENGDFTVEISRLLLDTEYYWQYYLLQNDVTIVGLPQTFEIADLYNVQSDLNISSASDLSSSASANCYIVSNSGLYKFKTVKGNSSTSVGNVASAAILWETFGTSTAPDYLELIDGVCYKDGYIAFQTADAFKEGNAVIAAKDADGNILWSWHIWFTDQPQAQVYNNDAGTMMDRNLGATSATPGDVGALGLLYQWGRKDPFLGSSSISSNTIAKSTIAWPSAVSSNSSNGTIEYATVHPTTFITYNSKNYDWYYTGDSSTDNSRWTTSSNDKSIYDPCPSGWRVPDGGSNGIWSKAGFYDTTYDSTNEGISFSISSPSTTWYPASGYRYYNDGSLNYVGNNGRYWSASPSSGYGDIAYGLSFNSDGYVDPAYYYNRAFGYSVRCLQESK
ncbi:MAG: hypothetical protein E7115_06790 [Bacteroidales bacterium]|nr:hypothetical protein [Bacteroidales bacterium]